MAVIDYDIVSCEREGCATLIERYAADAESDGRGFLKSVTYGYRDGAFECAGCNQPFCAAHLSPRSASGEIPTQECVDCGAAGDAMVSA